MSVENFKVIDVVSIDKNENAVLTVSDHLEWDEENEHLLILQSKINAYLAAIENGSLYEEYSNAKNRNIVIRIAAKYYPNKAGYYFFGKSKEYNRTGWIWIFLFPLLNHNCSDLITNKY